MRAVIASRRSGGQHCIQRLTLNPLQAEYERALRVLAGVTRSACGAAVGVDPHGNLLYAAANYQTVGSMAGRPGGQQPANLLSNMDRSPQRYLRADDRDFFAVYLR